MKTYIFILLFCCSLPSILYGQSACYEILKNEGLELHAHKQYEQAINKYLAALNCDSIDQNELATLIKQAQRARQNELMQERNAARASALTAQSVLALKQDRNPTEACRLAAKALQIVPEDIASRGAYIDAWYSQVYAWKNRYYAVPMAKTFRQTGILGNAALSPNGQIFATASWDPPIVKLWPVYEGETVSLLGFTQPVWRLRFSPDGNLLAVASLDGVVRIYSKEGRLLHRLIDHKGPVYDINYSSDGRYLISASQDSSATIWDMKTGEQILRLAEPNFGAVKLAVFSPDNMRILIANEDGQAFIRNIQRDQLIRLEHGLLPLTAAFFTPDGNQVITAGQEGSVKIWNINGQKTGEIAQLSRVDAMAPSLQGSNLFIGSRDGKVTVSDKSGNIIRSFQAHSDAVNGVVMAPDSLHFLTYSSDNTIKIWTMEGKLVLTLGEFTGPVLSAGLSTDGNTVYGSSWDGSARLFDLRSHPVDTYEGLGGNVQRVVVMPDGKQILAVSLNGKAMAWRLDHSDSLQNSPHAGWLRNVAVDRSGRQALITADSGIFLWNLDKNTWKRLPHTGGTAGRFFPDGTILTGAVNGSLKCWKSTGELWFDLDGADLDEAVSSLDISSDGRLIVSGHQDGSVALWSLQKRAVLWSNQYHDGQNVYTVCFSADNKYILSAGGDNRALLWNGKGEPVNVYKHAGAVTNAVFSTDGTWVLSNSADGTARLWKRDGDTAVIILRTPTSINLAALSPDGRMIATASNDGMIRLWSREGQLLTSLRASNRSVNWIAFFPKGDRLASAASDGRIHVWDLNALRLKPGLPPEEKH